MEEVEREKLGLIIRIRSCHLLDHLSGSSVELAPGAIGQPLIRRFLEERMPEPDGPSIATGDEFAEPRPYRIVASSICGQDRLEQVFVEAGSQHRSAPEDDPVSGRQAVDPRGHQGLNGVGEGVHLATRPCHLEQLLEEERVAAGAFCQGRDLMRGQRCVLRGEPGERGEVLRVEGAETDRHRPVAVAHGEPRIEFLAGRADQPWSGAHRAGQESKEVAGGLVHPVRIFEYQNRRPWKDLGHERVGGLFQAGPPEPLVELFGLWAGSDVRVDRDGKQRQPSKEFGRHGPDDIGEPTPCFRRSRLFGKAQELSKHASDREVRRRGLVRVACGRVVAHADGVRPKFLEEA
jgi:hypothetical protein